MILTLQRKDLEANVLDALKVLTSSYSAQIEEIEKYLKMRYREASFFTRILWDAETFCWVKHPTLARHIVELKDKRETARNLLKSFYVGESQLLGAHGLVSLSEEETNILMEAAS